MKKWWLHTVSCVCNGLSATVVLIFFIYEIINTGSTFTFADGLGVFVVLLGYTVYIVSDIWGLKLYNRYKNLEQVSFTANGKIHVILFFLTVVQLFTGYASYFIIRKLISNFPPSFKSIDSFWDILGYFILTIFFTSIIIFTGYIFILRALKKNKLILKEEIEKIGLQ